MGQKGIGREAFAQADLEFHLAVARAAHNPFFVSISALIEVVLVAMLTVSSPADEPDRLADSVVQHTPHQQGQSPSAMPTRHAEPCARSSRTASTMPTQGDGTGSADLFARQRLPDRAGPPSAAGMKPKTTPIRLDEDDRRGDRQRRISEPCAGQRAREAAAEREARRHARRARHDAETRIASVRNCRMMSPRARPTASADTDLAGALADRDQHDVHHADAADDERDDGDGRDQQRQRLARRRDRLADGVGVLEEEVLLAVERGPTDR